MNDADTVLLKKKTGFIKTYAMHLLQNGIDINSVYSLVNLKVLLQELSSTISTILETNKTDHSVKYQFTELGEYLKNNYYFNKKHKRKVEHLLLSISEIKKNRYQFSVDHYSLLQFAISDLLTDIQNNNFTGIIADIKYQIFSRENLEDSLSVLKSLVSDFLTALIQNGLSTKYIQKALNQTFELTEQGVNELTLEEALMKLLDSSLKQDSTITYVFKILGLKIMLPFRINDILFYNPMREDLLLRDFKDTLLKDESFLLSFSDQEKLKEIRENNAAISNEFHYFDCHARIQILGKDIHEGYNRALQKLQLTLNTLKFNYNLNNIRISNHYFALDHEKDITEHPILITDEYSINKHDISYSPQGLNTDIIDDLESQNSSLNQFLMNNKTDYQKIIFKVLFWYEKGNEASSDHEKFINYWIALEFLIKNSKTTTIKKQLLNLIPKILVLISFRNELRSLYHYFNREFSSFGSVGYYPDELKKIEGLEHFITRVDLDIFAKHLLEFKKYSTDEHINFRIDCFYTTYNNVQAQKKHFELLKNKFSYLTGRIYRIRNNIVHEASIYENDLAIYTNWLKYCLRVLLNNCDTNSSNSLPSWEECIQLFQEWNDKVRKNILIKIC